MTIRAVHWHEGMFLRPQHFQAEHRHALYLAHRSGKIDTNYNWGLRSIDLDGDALSNNRFEVRSLLARMRDGTVVEVPADGVLPTVELKGLLEQKAAITFYLALPIVSLSKANAAAEASSQGARYLVETQELEDENTGINPQPIDVRRLNLRLLVDSDDHTGYEVLPLARIQKSIKTDATPQLDETYIPPVLACDTWKPLALGIVRNLYDRIGKKIEALAGQVRMRGITLDSHGLGDAALVGQLRELNSMYSRLSILTFADGVPPFQAYLELCTLVGQLSLFGPTHRPPELPRYDHDDLGGCFYRVKRYLDELLSLMVEPGYKERPFIGTGSRMQVALETSWLEPVWELYIGVQSALTPEECIQLLTVRGQLDMKIGSAERVESIYRLGQAGLQFTPRLQPPHLLPAAPGLVYFQVRREPQGIEWQHVQRSLTLALRLNENRIAGSIQGARVMSITLGNQTVQFQFTLYVIPAGELPA